MNNRWLGIDYGQSRIGLAISDELGCLAHPYRTLHTTGNVIGEFQAILDREKLSGIVIGLPKNMDGTLGESAILVKRFGQQIAESIPSIKIVFWDERLTTREAQRALHASGKNTRQSKKMIDQVSAQILLQSYLDSLQWLPAENR
jgi:putative holliday junction resolvase